MTRLRFCENCGAALNPGARFCSGCGQQVKALPAAPLAGPPSPSTPAPFAAMAGGAAPAVGQPAGERVLGVIAGAQRRNGLFGAQTFNIVVTSQRIVFAEMSPDVQANAVREAAGRADRGAVGQWAAQWGWLQHVVGRYAAMPPDQALRESEANFALAPAQVRRVTVGHVVERDADGDRRAADRLTIEAVVGKYEFTLTAGKPDEARELLRQVFGAAVR